MNEDIVLIVQEHYSKKVLIFLKQGNKHMTINIKVFTFHLLFDN